MKRYTGNEIRLHRNLWMSVAAGVIAGLAPLPSASAAHGNFSKGIGAAFGHGFRSHPYSKPHGYRHHAHSYRAYGGAFVPYVYSVQPYRHPNQSGFYWPRQNIYPAAVPSQGRIYVVPTPTRVTCGRTIRRHIIINPSPYQEAGSAILNRSSFPKDEEDFLDEDQSTSLDLNFPENPDAKPAIDAAVAWTHLNQGRARQALALFSSWALAEPTNQRHKFGYGLAAAMCGDKLTAAYALRLVYESDEVDALRDMAGPDTTAFKMALNSHVDPSGDDSLSVDDMFLAGVYCHLNRDRGEGLHWVDQALASGDESASLKNLGQALRSMNHSEVTAVVSAQ